MSQNQDPKSFIEKVGDTTLKGCLYFFQAVVFVTAVVIIVTAVAIALAYLL